MAINKPPRRRPGGRSARLWERVHAAVVELLSEQRRSHTVSAWSFVRVATPARVTPPGAPHGLNYSSAGAFSAAVRTFLAEDR